MAGILLPLIGFAFVTSITPGPNNLMLMTSGANFGLRRSLPHMAGVALGLPIMIFPVGLGVMQVFDRWPVSYTLLKISSVGYMLWLAWKIAHAAAPATVVVIARVETAPPPSPGPSTFGGGG